MTWLARLLGVAPAPLVPPAAVTVPAPIPITCPDCSATSYTKLCDIVTAERTSEATVPRVVGARFSCQRCPCIFSSDERGTFKHHWRSLPPTLQLPERETNPDNVPPAAKPRPIREELPVPRQRPRV